MRTYRLGTRGSRLALWQAEHVMARLNQLWPDVRIELATIHTTADKRQDVPLRQIGDKSLFIKEIEAALLDGSIELAVHSLKDVPSRLDNRFGLSAILEREDPRDVLLTQDGGGLSGLRSGARIGTSSLRREAQLRAALSNAAFAPIRGNVDTRLRKLEAGEYDAIVLAAAGLKRLGLPLPAAAFLDPTLCLPAPGQAAICVETLAGQGDLVAPLDHTATRRAVEAERAFAAELDAGCHVPVAAYATVPPFSAAGGGALDTAIPAIELHGLVASPDGSRLIRVNGVGDDAAELGRRLGRAALDQGAAELLRLA